MHIFAALRKRRRFSPSTLRGGLERDPRFLANPRVALYFPVEAISLGRCQ